MKTRDRIFGKVARAALALAPAIVLAQAGWTQTFTTLVTFDGSNGAIPYYGSLSTGTDGNLYGTTYQGGANDSGTVFKITTGGALTILHSFDSTDGANPGAGLIQATNGNFYGTTVSGGANGLGTIFKITAGGTLTTVHNFDFTDGANPYSGLIQATNGSFYGTTVSSEPSGNGTIFKITAGGTLTTLHSFDHTDGSYPYGGLIQAHNGNLYGTTEAGGANCAPIFGCGTVFEMTPNGTLTTLDTFDSTDGSQPFGALVQATDGNFYGTTLAGGTKSYGTVFRVSAAGKLTTLHNFDSNGAYPRGGLIQATDGNLYGTTSGRGGANGNGTIFEITTGGALTTLHSFDQTGDSPLGGLLQGTDGSFYGATSYGGTSNYGTVFTLSVGLGPFVKTLPTSGKVGSAVKILGTNLTGATSVTFNGTAAAFTVVRPSEISTTVPAGATTGTVQVTTPGGTLSSNVAFRVLP
jgi:uncharacterized repeat protein (TIGR03803 family)